MKNLSELALTIGALREGYGRGEFKPLDVVHEVFRRVERFNDNPIWIHLMPEA